MYHDNDSGTLVQLIFRERMNGITLGDEACNMFLRDRERKQKELEDKGRGKRKRERQKKVSIEQTLYLTLIHVFLQFNVF
jgi:hypothetical protein